MTQEQMTEEVAPAAASKPNAEDANGLTDAEAAKRLAQYGEKTDFALSSVPAFWPMAMAAVLFEQGAELYAKNLKFVEEEIKINEELRPSMATPNRVRLDLRTMVLREYGEPGGLPTLVDAPHAGHTAMIADYRDGQSLVQTLLANGVGHVALTDWKPATYDMKDLEIDNYLAEIVVAIDDLGGRVNLVGLCQGGWVSAMIAARFPDKVNSLVLAGAPIDTDAGNSPITRMVHESPLSFYEELVGLGGGLMKGKLRHIGLFMGQRTLIEYWPQIAKWIAER